MVMPERTKYSLEPEEKRAFTDSWDASYSRIAGAYDLAVKWFPLWKTWLRQAIPHIQGPRVLEVSFGTGYLLAQYAGSFETYGIDYNREMVRTARKNLAKKKSTRSFSKRASSRFLTLTSRLIRC